MEPKKADISPGTQPHTEEHSACLLSPEEREEQYQTMVKRLEAIAAEPEPLSTEVLHNELQALRKRVEALEAGEFGR